MGHHLHLLGACCLPACLGLASLATPQPLFLVNTSPSEPLGLYVRSKLPPAAGRLAAFHPPAAGRAYAAAHLPEIGRGGILKRLAAGPGSRVCAQGRVFLVNGRPLGTIQLHDHAGRALPRWEGCVTLGPGQFVAYSDRIPNSFDSRYYGPVGPAEIIGAYEPLWVRP